LSSEVRLAWVGDGARSPHHRRPREALPDMNAEMREIMTSGRGFVAALDQSGGSTPKALAHYGIAKDAYSTDGEMFDLVHQMRTRIITSPVFSGERVIAAILFEGTMDRQIEGQPSAKYLWDVKHVVPIVKVDKGLEAEANGVQLMKPMPQLQDLLSRALDNGVFGTKMRSVIKTADKQGVTDIVAQQFAVGNDILAAGLVPILEPEVDIHSPSKQEAEDLLHQAIMDHLDALPADQQMMLKLTIPSVDGFYSDVIAHPRVMRVVALSGGYTREEANDKLARNPGLIASFSRALIGELSANQSDDEFNATLDEAIQSIYDASVT
jgi:fructose-bisphosphate aldolase class I